METSTRKDTPITGLNLLPLFLNLSRKWYFQKKIRDRDQMSPYFIKKVADKYRTQATACYTVMSKGREMKNRKTPNAIT
jgi:hypothetical protein